MKAMSAKRLHSTVQTILVEYFSFMIEFLVADSTSFTRFYVGYTANVLAFPYLLYILELSHGFPVLVLLAVIVEVLIELLGFPDVGLETRSDSTRQRQ
jgi:hypothetical protein